MRPFTYLVDLVSWKDLKTSNLVLVINEWSVEYMMYELILWKTFNFLKDYLYMYKYHDWSLNVLPFSFSKTNGISLVSGMKSLDVNICQYFILKSICSRLWSDPSYLLQKGTICVFTTAVFRNWIIELLMNLVRVRIKWASDGQQCTLHIQIDLR